MLCLFHSILKVQIILLCVHLPLLYSADHLSWLPMVAWQQSVSNSHESDLLGPAREGGKTPECSALSVTSSMTHQGS